MKNKVKSLLMVFTVAFGLSFGIAACSGGCDHTYTDKVVAPTCTVAGYTLHTCSKCGDSFSDTETEALGHDYQDSVVAPKCVDKGYTLHACSRCDESYRDTETDAIGHDFAQTLSYNAEGHYHECTRCDEHDTLVEHDYDETDYKFSANGHYTQCECGAKSAEQAHSYTQEVKNDDTLKNEANCLEPTTYFKSCVCGFISTADTFTDGEALGHDLQHHEEAAGTETTKASIEYWECLRDDCGKLYSDAQGTTQITENDIYSAKIGRLLTVNDKNDEYSDDRFVRNDDGTMSYTKAAGAPASESAKLWFGQQNGNDCTAWEFDLTVAAGDAGELSLIFRAWDDSNLYRLVLCSPESSGRLELVKRRWVEGQGAQTLNKRRIDGFAVQDNTEYHVSIVCLGHDKVVIINDKIVCRIQESDLCAGYFGIEGKGMNSIVIDNAYLRTYTGEEKERIEAGEADYPDFWEELSEGITDVCDHEYVDTVVPPTCMDDGYTTHTCKFCDNEYTDETVPSVGAHLYDSYTNNGANHTATCSACGDTIEQDHSFVKEVKNDDTVKIAENHEHGATYYKSCECGAISTSDTDTFTMAPKYTYLKDITDRTNNFTQEADGSITYTRGTGDESVCFTIGSQNDNPQQYVSFDLEFAAYDWGSFELQFGRWDPNVNIAIVRGSKLGDAGKFAAINTKWTAEEPRHTVAAWDIGGFSFADETKYHVAIMRRGPEKTVIVNNVVIFRQSINDYNVGTFHFESWALHKLKISHIFIDENFDSDAAFETVHPEVWSALSDGITNTQTVG